MNIYLNFDGWHHHHAAPGNVLGAYFGSCEDRFDINWMVNCELA